MDQTEHKTLLEEALHFPDGLPGLPTLEHFVIVELREDGVFQHCKASTTLTFP